MTDPDAFDAPHDPAAVPSESRGWAAAAQLLPLLGFGFIAPLVIWLIKRDEDPFVERHAREALNFQISLIIYMVISVILMLVLIGFLLFVIVAIWGLVVMIIAGVRAASGEEYSYPMILRLVN